MPLFDDGDIVRGLGFVTLYAGHLEQEVDDLLTMLDSIERFDQKKQRWPISQKLKHAAKLIRKLGSPDLYGLPEAIDGAIALFERRNEYVHGLIFAGQKGIDYIQAGRPKATPKPITSAELYSLANEIWAYRGHLIRPRPFRLPRVIAQHCSGHEAPAS